MRLDINLATRPYEDARQFWMRWGTGVGVLAVIALTLLIFTISGWYNARQDHKRISELRAQIADLEKEKTQAEAMLNRPENRAMRDRSQYLNELIARKAFSWTKAIEGLEKVMPAKLHLVSIEPQLNEDNHLSIKMVVAGDSPDRGIELVRRMEESKHFKDTRIERQVQMPQQGGDNVQFDINALYVPIVDSGSTR
jgi:type IV pilus assembly protein PilN